MTSINKQLDQAICEFANATDQLDAKRRLLSEARTAETAAMNRVNEAQKKIDELYAELKKLAPRDSDWGVRSIGRAVATPAPPRPPA